MIIDAHTHFYDPSRPQGVPWPAPDSGTLYRPVLPQHFAAVAAPCGVTGTVVVEASPWVEDNQWVLDLAAREPAIVGFVGHLAPAQPTFGALLRRFAANPLFRGIRWGAGPFSTLPSRERRRSLRQLVELDLELDVLIGKEHLASVSAAARALPELRVVIDHVGHVPIDGRQPDAEWAAGMRQAARAPGVYVKISALLELSRQQPAPADPGFYAPTLEVLWQAFGEERLIFGSNWPVCERAVA